MARRLTDTYFVECEYFYTITKHAVTSEEHDGYYKFLIEVKPQEHIINALQDAIRNYLRRIDNDAREGILTIRRIYIYQRSPHYEQGMERK